MYFKLSKFSVLFLVVIITTSLLVDRVQAQWDDDIYLPSSAPVEASSPQVVPAPVLIRSPRYVCNPRCVGYAEGDDSESFIADRCCTFIPCPVSGGYSHQQYDDFRTKYCIQDNQ